MLDNLNTLFRLSFRSAFDDLKNDEKLEQVKKKLYHGAGSDLDF